MLHSISVFTLLDAFRQSMYKLREQCLISKVLEHSWKASCAQRSTNEGPKTFCGWVLSTEDETGDIWWLFQLWALKENVDLESYVWVVTRILQLDGHFT